MCERCEPSSSSSQSLSPLLCLYWACRSSTPLSTIRTSRRPAVDAFRRLTRPAGTARRLAVDASWRDFLHSSETFFTAARPSVSRRDFLPIPTRLSVFRQDFLPIPTRLSADPDGSRTFIGDPGEPGDLRDLGDPGEPGDLRDPGDPGDPILQMSLPQRKEDPRGPSAGRSARRLRKGLEDSERALNRGPREFSRSSEEPCAVDAW